MAEGLLQGLTQLLPGVATILGTLCVMAVLNPFIAFVVVAVTPLSIWFAGFVAKRTAGFFARQQRGAGPPFRLCERDGGRAGGGARLRLRGRVRGAVCRNYDRALHHRA